MSDVIKDEKVEQCALCEGKLEAGNGDNWGDLCPECADKVSAYMDENQVGDEEAVAFLKDHPEWSSREDEPETMKESKPS
jgi:hypothetical protein